MDKNYIKFVIAYDFCSVFEKMELACDEAYDLAEEIANRFIQYTEENEFGQYYDILNDFCNEISFEEVWNQLQE